MYERVIVPLNGSAAAEQALPHAVEIARRFGASITLVRTVISRRQAYTETMTATTPDLSADVAQRRHAAAWDAAHRYLTAVQQRLQAAGLPVTIRVAEGSVAIAVRDAASGGALVCMAAHRRRRWRPFGGSVSRDILRAVDAPVLVIRARA